MVYFALLAIAVSLLAIAAFGCGIGQGIAVYGAANGMARQPDMAGKIQLVMFVGLAFIESLTIYSLMVSFILLGKLPKTEAVLEVIQHAIK
ncbi:ATP synthase subunit c [Candidatus Kuenenia stuttgartiensis]|uniref:ATP synthase subunit c n=1 Tax=Kuenenia stuttgartiensis TaxID=174633 RepID=Q1Q3F5_KUEST|nr:MULTISPECIES: ATP synthase F0 subunit C [Kuenenia]MBE7546947.1 ATP synthase F0 subunit C [Planctomycetia bacterium]MBW7942697.1 ATP synthase F0 subunit C [Candidatus Kuenenia stuttgartiensis]MCF6151422.1 ATP synthase F0 subunit C [Candidatus Kuenenia stuttgartiensis]MCZ7623123.1 ATP synthase F0 subunit C [Candidatus Kuenenia sp.]QII11662.1 ATP synthase subunit c [Candidatus Kuenenia stuttgartiensis]